MHILFSACESVNRSQTSMGQGRPRLYYALGLGPLADFGGVQRVAAALRRLRAGCLALAPFGGAAAT